MKHFWIFLRVIVMPIAIVWGVISLALVASHLLTLFAMWLKEVWL